MALQLKILFKYVRLVISTVSTNCHSRKHTETTYICRAVIGIGAAHITLLAVEKKIITHILALIILVMTAMSCSETSFIPRKGEEVHKYRNMCMCTAHDFAALMWS